MVGLTTNSQWLNYATSRLKEMFQTSSDPQSSISSFMLSYAGDHNQRAAEA